MRYLAAWMLRRLADVIDGLRPYEFEETEGSRIVYRDPTADALGATPISDLRERSYDHSPGWAKGPGLYL